jgi:hypothetical protein
LHTVGVFFEVILLLLMTLPVIVASDFFFLLGIWTQSVESLAEKANVSLEAKDLSETNPYCCLEWTRNQLIDGNSEKVPKMRKKKREHQNAARHGLEVD